MNKILGIVFVVGVILLVVLGYFFVSVDNDKIEAGDISRTKEGEIVILITDKGFKPPELAVPVGSTIKWVNTSGGVHSVTFNYLTNLENLTGVDQNLNPKDTLTYKFEKSGKFSYFDRRDNFGGSIEVK